MAGPSSEQSVTKDDQLSRASNTKRAMGENTPVLGLMSVEDFERQFGDISLEKTDPLEPIPISKARALDAVIRLHHMCQERRVLAPEYEYDKNDSQQFSVKMRLADQVLEEDGPFSSKKEAKQAISEKGLEMILLLPTHAKSHENNEPKVVSKLRENFIGIVNEFSQSHDKSSPIFNEFMLGSGFSCELILSVRRDKCFGSRTVQFMSKKEARVNAAQEAVHWLRQHGMISEARKTIPKARSMRSSSDCNAPSTEENAILKISSLCSDLNIQCPRFYFDSPSPSFYSGGAYFDFEPSIPSPVGEVRNIFGKKKAKEECARRVVELLLELKSRKDEAS